jgi:hypothetical protein
MTTGIIVALLSLSGLILVTVVGSFSERSLNLLSLQPLKPIKTMLKRYHLLPLAELFYFF